MLYHRVPDYQLLHHYEHFNFSRYHLILYDIVSYKPASHLFPLLVNATPSHC
jgi:hypothetical protein